MSICTHCGKGIEEGGLYCSECQAMAGAKKPRRIWLFSLVFSGLLLLLTGMMLWHGGLGFGDFSLDMFWRKPVAVINGEEISRADLRARLKALQAILERQHGNDLFAGDRGRILFLNLERKVLNDMLDEKLVKQEARNLGIKVSDKQVEQKIDLITKEVFGTRENFQTRLREENLSEEDLQNNIRYALLLEALKKAKAPERGNPDVSFTAWLIQARQKAEVTYYRSNNPSGSLPSSAGGCCSATGSPGGCGGTSATQRPIDPKIERDAQNAAREAFLKSNPSEKDVSAKVTDYGCHIQVDIQKNGKVVKSYTYQNGKVLEDS